MLANSIDRYDDALSRELTEKVKRANLDMRALGFKPYAAPALSSGALAECGIPQSRAPKYLTKSKIPNTRGFSASFAAARRTAPGVPVNRRQQYYHRKAARSTVFGILLFVRYFGARLWGVPHSAECGQRRRLWTPPPLKRWTKLLIF